MKEGWNGMSEKENLNQAAEEIAEAAAEEVKTQPAKEEKAPKAKKDKKPKEKDKKPGLGKRLGRFFREMKAELKKVSWPSRAETLKKTGIVILCVLIVGVIVWIFDGIANGLINALLSLFGH